jgi:hypothetical protein
MPIQSVVRRPVHWLVQGLLSADNRFVRAPAFSAEAIGPATLDPRSPLQVELFDANRRLLLRAGIPLTTPCTDGPGRVPSYRLAAGTIPVPAETVLVRFMLDDVLLEEYRVPAGEPRTVLTAIPPYDARGVIKVSWRSEHPDNAPLVHIVGFSADDGVTWEPAGLPTGGDVIELDLNARPGGERCRICVKTSDGFHTTTALSEPFALPVKPCVAMILAPEPGVTIRQGAVLHLQGQGYWLEEHRPELDALFWSSSQAGALGRGARVDVKGLPAGRHEITLAAGEGERAGRASIDIVVVER